MSQRTKTERDAYLRGLADDYGVDMYVVRNLADMLGPNEDYDGLVTALEDFVETAEDMEG